MGSSPVADNYLKTSGSLWHRNKPTLDNNDDVADFTSASQNSKTFKHKQKVTGQTGTNDRKKSWNNSAIEIFKLFLENSWNAFN